MSKISTTFTLLLLKKPCAPIGERLLLKPVKDTLELRRMLVLKNGKLPSLFKKSDSACGKPVSRMDAGRG
ncbi:hypothetical protein AZI86_07970 [Bdellovibrio bacteriovorus]|uniref:Uncharacterized protein n=1 Tax=Bdellovibrio bacteriovorus TaxID=959 RepID=A0A150WR38_BDEBC|nr:hypothetical protein AZI86_07970 [Bdellovibrio bacteriovorus]